RKRKFQNIWLLIASLFFYGWGEPRYVLLMILSIMLNFTGGLLISRAAERRARIAVLASTVALNLALLFYFKYIDFAIGAIDRVFGVGIPIPEVALPIGISFFTFQGMTYVIDVYRGDAQVQRNPLNVGLYISLFPQLIAGPIVRYKDIAKQIDGRHVSLEDMYDGIIRFIIGLGKKVIIANQMAIVADAVFNYDPSLNTPASCWLGLLCYTLQIFFDFSGYSDMAIGLGRMFGFHFMENFNYPYISKSIREFWRRWHISLSTFFRDYLYIPMGGSRKGNVYLHLVVVFFATGLWHGAAYTFVVWGMWHGFFIVAERCLGSKVKLRETKALGAVKHVYTLAVVMLGWAIFRSDGMSRTLAFIQALAGAGDHSAAKVSVWYFLDSYTVLIMVAGILFSMPAMRKLEEKLITDRDKITAASIAKPIIVMGIFLASCVLVMNSSYNPFLYFRF
ncbi:MAG: MBOAT family protein, partial [Clostridiales Family XIII bacterium]|nr:MBOAT family protein [Clostridiales Family XIII bacterium]